MTYKVYLTEEAREDLIRLEDHLIDLALKHADADVVDRAMDAIRGEMRILETNPYTCRMASDSPYERELVIPFGGTGYVALFEIDSTEEVVVTALRHQREDDYH